MGSDAYDIAIIGAGSGGMTAARCAREAGLDVLIFESRSVGGTCVNRCCVPKKPLVHASRHRERLDQSATLGWSIGAVEFNWATLRDGVADYTRALAKTMCFIVNPSVRSATAGTDASTKARQSRLWTAEGRHTFGQ